MTRWRSGRTGASKHLVLPRTRHVSNHISWCINIDRPRWALFAISVFAEKLRKISPSPMTTGSATAAAQKRRRLGRAIANAQLAGYNASSYAAAERKQCLDCLNMMIFSWNMSKCTGWISTMYPNLQFLLLKLNHLLHLRPPQITCPRPKTRRCQPVTTTTSWPKARKPSCQLCSPHLSEKKFRYRMIEYNII